MKMDPGMGNGAGGPDGLVGKLRIHKSGKMTVQIGDITFEVH
jgi:hypothetical protein